MASQSNVPTTTTVAARPADAELQAQANEVAVKAGCPASHHPDRGNHQKYTAAPPMTIDTSKTYTATVKTTTGTFDVALDAKTAPETVNNFVFLANKGYFHCVIFLRVIPGFMVQTGDPDQTNTGTEPGYTIPDENPAKAANPAQQYPLGSVAMANTGSPNTGGSQFFIVAGPQGETPAQHLLPLRPGHIGHERGRHHRPAGLGQGVPPDVTQRIISVTINES